MDQINEIKNLRGLMLISMTLGMQQYLAESLLKRALKRDPTLPEVMFCVDEFWRKAVSDWMQREISVCQQIHDLVWDQ